ncbi:unnamed protein product, partial [Ectocarpus sp. 12 AP-2014]
VILVIGPRTTRASWCSYPLEIVVRGCGVVAEACAVSKPRSNRRGDICYAPSGLGVLLLGEDQQQQHSTAPPTTVGRPTLSLKSTELWVFAYANSHRARRGSEPAAAPLAAAAGHHHHRKLAPRSVTGRAPGRSQCACDPGSGSLRPPPAQPPTPAPSRRMMTGEGLTAVRQQPAGRARGTAGAPCRRDIAAATAAVAAAAAAATSPAATGAHLRARANLQSGH